MSKSRKQTANFRDRLYARLVYWPTLGWNYLLGRVLGRRRWWDEVIPGLYLGARPLPGDPDRLAAMGIGGIVNTCEEFCGYQRDYDRLGIEQFWMPTTDFTHPQLTDVLGAVEFIARQRQMNRGVYVHCKAGRARSATVVLAYLIANEHWEPQAAMELMLKARPHINPKLLDRPVIQQVIERVR